jgi:hypothetical protein
MINFLENILFIPSVGLQYTSTFATGRTNLNFYHISQINDIIINEHLSLVILMEIVS